MDIELIADTVADRLSFEDGAARVIDLMRQLQQLPAFAAGWRIGTGRIPLEQEAAFIGQAAEDMGPESAEIGMHQLVAASASPAGAEGTLREDYLLSAQFGRETMLPPHINIGLTTQLASLDLIKQVIVVLLEWSTIQHVKVADPWYAMEDAPLDARRRGIGWAGWVPFELTTGQVPEAAVLEPLGRGTFLASSLNWDTSDTVTIPQAQNLELRLNGLGVLPTMEDLAGGLWGQRRD